MSLIESLFNELESSEHFEKISENMSVIANSDKREQNTQDNIRNLIDLLSTSKIRPNTLAALQLMADQQKFDRLHEMAMYFMQRRTQNNHLRLSTKVKNETFSLDIDMW